jgi:hypothetical protein
MKRSLGHHSSYCLSFDVVYLRIPKCTKFATTIHPRHSVLRQLPQHPHVKRIRLTHPTTAVSNAQILNTQVQTTNKTTHQVAL